MENNRKNGVNKYSESGSGKERPGSSYGTRRVAGSERVRAVGNPQAKAVRTDGEKKRRIDKKQKKRRLRAVRMRAAAAVIALAAVTVILLFMTPLFDIGEIRLEGNELVNKSDIESKVGYLLSENLFRARKDKIAEAMLEIPPVKTAEVDKNMFPPYITIKITECLPAAYLLSGDRFIIIDSDLKVIDDSGSIDAENVPSISGVSVSSYELNKTLDSGSEEKDEILRMLLGAFETTGLTDEVTYISVEDLTSIRFNFENRLEVLCGSKLELERKIRMFAEIINSKEISANAIGTVDLRDPGTASYTPYIT